jgi:O-acetyl-ADP-ribose deacetylase (regulator of RNase III)
VVQGDITLQDTESIGNAANSALAGGGGVDGAIHRAGGPAIMAELKAKYKGCPAGSAVITGGGNLKAHYVIHAVGPRYSGSPKDQNSYRAPIEESGIVPNTKLPGCLPSISTGIAGILT